MIEHGLRRSRAANLSASLIAIVTFAVALGMDFRPQYPVVPHASGAAPVRGGFGLDPAPRVWLAWSSPAEANAEPANAPGDCASSDYVDGAGALPSPCRPGAAAPGKTLLASLARETLPLRAALDALQKGDLASARALARRADPVTEHIVAWVALTSGVGRPGSTEVESAMKVLQDWPRQSEMRGRLEEALAREQPEPGRVLQAFAQTPPHTVAGTVLYAKALLRTGRVQDARDVVGEYWREKVCAGGEQPILSNFAGLLSPADHQARIARLLGQGKTADAEKAAQFLDKNAQQQVQAWIAMRKESANAEQDDAAAPVEGQPAPAALFARVQSLRRAGSNVIAAVLMEAAPTDPGALVDPDAWSEERRVLARNVAEYDPALAFELTSVSPGVSPSGKADSEFDAGRYALRLNRPAEAAQHFQVAASAAATPAKWARAEYWLGRAFDAAGQMAAAEDRYREAGRAPTTFYGQLALSKIGTTELPVPGGSVVSEAVGQRFRARELVQATARLVAIGRREDAAAFYRHLAGTLTDPAEIALLAEMIDDQRDPSFALHVGQVADVGQAPAEALAFPLGGVPPLDRQDVELPAVYAVARQESAFRASAVSPVGAQGLLQLMPTTAKEVADRLGLDYSKERLGADPAYNATLGAAFLGSLLAEFNGSYAMSFAAYNAGAGRVQEWVKAYGDPRDRGTDVADWIESIPIEETRNYVQRTLENLQVYRARLGRPQLDLAADLTGQPGYRPDPLATAAAKPVTLADNTRPPPVRAAAAAPRPSSPPAVKSASAKSASTADKKPSAPAPSVKVAQSQARHSRPVVQVVRVVHPAPKKEARRV